MTLTTRILTGEAGWSRADQNALTALYAEHGGSAPADLDGLLDWSRSTGTPLTAIVLERDDGPGLERAIESDDSTDAGGAVAQGSALGEARALEASAPQDATCFDGAILLTHRRVAGLTSVRLVGHRWADQQSIPLRNPEAAGQLADGVIAWLAGFRRWRLDLEQVPIYHRFLQAMSARDRTARLDVGDPLPYLDWPATRTTTNWAPKKFRQQSRQALRRLTEERGEPSILTFDTTADVLARMNEYHQVFDAREQEVGRPSAIRSKGVAATKESVLRRLGDQKRLQSWELRAGDDLVAYYVTIRSGTTRRMWDGRMAPGWSHVSPGTILMGHILQDWHQDSAIHRVDFMRGDTVFKRRLSNGELATQRLRMWSSPRLAGNEMTLTEWDDRGRNLVRAARDHSPALRQMIRRIR